LAVPLAEFDLSNVTTRRIYLFRYQRRAVQAGARFARRDVFASVDANGRRGGIEIGLKHALKLIAVLDATDQNTG
jgi:hypothetical protein